MKVKDFNAPDTRPLLVKAADYKNSREDNYMPPITLGRPKANSKEAKRVMAMDSCIKNVLSGIQDELSYMAMPKFLGYAMLSNISQEALIRAGVETIADEMTRKFVEWTYDDDDGNEAEKKEKLIMDMEGQAAKYKLKETFNDALIKDGNFGGCLIYIDVGDIDDEEAAEPLVLKKETFKKGMFRGFKVIEPINIYPGSYNTSDPTNEDYFKPEYWYVLGRRYHASRFIYIASNEAPLLLKPAYNFFGIPRAQLALDYVAQFVANRESAQELLNKFSLTCWKTNMAQELQGKSLGDLTNRAKLFNKMKHNTGVMLLDKESEDMVQINTPLGGVRDIVEMSLNLLTAVWRIPKIKYLGEGEGGLNASSVEQMRSFYDFILSQKEKVLTQPMEIVLKIFQLNLGYDINESLGFKFPSMVEMDESERANLNKMQADRDNIYLSAGVISQQEVRQRLSMDKNSGYSMIDIDDVPEVPEEPLKDDEKVETDEEDRIAADMAMDEFNEVDHPRDEEGRFISKTFYHGGKSGIEKFDKEKIRTSGQWGYGFYFSEDKSVARNFAIMKSPVNGKVYSVKLDIKKPFTDRYKFLEIQKQNEYDIKKTTDEIKKQGYDGIVIGGEYVVFEPEQIKIIGSEMAMDEFAENEHPRDENGKFTNKGKIFEGHKLALENLKKIAKRTASPYSAEELLFNSDVGQYGEFAKGRESSVAWYWYNGGKKLQPSKEDVDKLVEEVYRGWGDYKSYNDLPDDETRNFRFNENRDDIVQYRKTMVKDEEPEDWITINGNHIPVYKGQSKKDAVEKFINGIQEGAKKYFESESKGKKEEPKKESGYTKEDYRKDSQEFNELREKMLRDELTDKEAQRYTTLQIRLVQNRHVTSDEKPTFIQKVRGFFKK